MKTLRVSHMLTLLALLGACGVTPQPGPAAEGGTIAIQGWTPGQTGTARFYRNATVNNLIDEFPIDASGKLTYSLRVPQGLIPFTSGGGIVVNPADLQVQYVTSINTRLASETTDTGELRLGNRLINLPDLRAGDTLVQLMYADRNARITGSTGECEYDMNLKAGWNYNLREQLTATTCKFTASGNLPAGINWYSIYIGP